MSDEGGGVAAAQDSLRAHSTMLYAMHPTSQKLTTAYCSKLLNVLTANHAANSGTTHGFYTYNVMLEHATTIRCRNCAILFIPDY
jgi:hypothetical protein